MSSQRYISDTLKKKKKNVKKIKVYLWVILFASIVVGLLYLVRMPYIQIFNVQVNGNTFVTTQEIQLKTNDVLNKTILGFIPKSNFFIFSKTELENSLKQNPAIVSVNIKKSFFKTIDIEIVEQEKEMVYCTSTEHVDCLYINNIGFIYAKVSDFIIPEQEVLIYDEQSIRKIQDTILEEKLYVDVVTFIKSSIRNDIKIGEVYIKPDGIIEFVTRDHARIITSIYDDYEKDFTNMLALFQKTILTREELSQIDYIDMRFGNKIFYKNKTN